MSEFNENFWRAGRIASRIYRERRRALGNTDDYDDEYTDDEMIFQNEIYHRLEFKEEIKQLKGK